MSAFRRFALVCTGHVVSRIGSGMTLFALGVSVLERTESTIAYSTLLVAGILPTIVAAPALGFVVDRLDRRWAMVIGNVGAASGICVLLSVSTTAPVVVYVAVGLGALFSALHSAALKASVSDVLDERDHGRASGLVQLAEASQFIIAPVLAGIASTQLGLRFVLGVDLVTFALATAAVFWLPRSRGHDGMAARSFWRSTLEGWRHLTSSPALRALVVTTCTVTFVVGALQALFAPIVLSFGGPETLGVVQSTAAVGMLLGTVYIGMAGRTNIQRRHLTAYLVAVGCTIAMLGFARDPYTFTVIAFAFFATLPFLNTSLELHFRVRTGSEMQGRMWSLVSALSEVATASSIAITGFVAERWANPSLKPGGLLADSVGAVVGTGDVRGSSMIVVIAGVILSVYVAHVRRRTGLVLHARERLEP